MTKISISGLAKRYGATVAVEDFNLDVEEGELVVFLGPSGCGKTTTLRMIAGFIDPSEGSIRLGSREITGVPAYDRNIGVVFQNYALFPHLSVSENVAFGLRRRKVVEATIASKVAEALELVRMGHLAARMPRELSGGQQQRVAIARAIVISPDILLLDEPLSNLDAKLRLSIRQEIRRLQKTLGITTVLVTHDQEEAMSIADRLVVMSQGRVQQIGTPADIYARPLNPFVADFIGQANFIAGSMHEGAFVTAGGASLAVENASADCDLLVIRPEQVEISRERDIGAENEVDAIVESKTYLGAGILAECRVAEDVVITVHLGSSDPLASITEGDHVHLRLPKPSLMAMRRDENAAAAA
ncbi:ABC transporter ATP-binding protein [Bosea sp. LjRoot9]|uniref:ABC transporter ATP-binding protein n=1 Tax=Bosea sp. LjRoot9 TaxID=3342341 RepID=UPI003F500460